MAEESIEERAVDVISHTFGIAPSDITRETLFIDDLNADPMDVVMEFEDAFDIEIDDEDVKKFLKVGEFIDYIIAKLAEKPPATP